MPRLYLYLRIVAVVIGFPVILIYIAVATVVRSLSSLRSGLRTPLRIWMSIVDWVKGIPVGYSYWEQYEAPIMLDEIVVHHDE